MRVLFATVIMLLGALLLSLISENSFILEFVVFLLSLMTGFQIIGNIKPQTHILLFSLLIALSGIIIIVCIELMILKSEDKISQILGRFALPFVVFNIGSGYTFASRIVN